jgi:endogenous inhibitor of DNA gyrase (YacG/DUF329 family)
VIAPPTCPICSKPILAGIAEKSAFPFCSERCRQVDLLRWSKGEYQIVEPLAPPAFEEEASSSEE